jgi:molybdopterin/thiamine biosynthesis adenylyltransferase
MTYSATFIESVYNDALTHLSSDQRVEHAGYFFGRISTTDRETRFILREFTPVAREHILVQKRGGTTIAGISYVRAIQHADRTQQSFWFVHSHPKDCRWFSAQDDNEEPRLFRTAAIRIDNPTLHGSIVFPLGSQPIARVWSGGKIIGAIERIRSIGRRFRFVASTRNNTPLPEFVDRQVRAFGPDLQRILQRLHIAVVGAGGTGSAVCEQLIRLGVGELSIYDPQQLEESNVNRVYGSSIRDKDASKVELIRRLAEFIGVGTVVHPYAASVYEKEAAMTLRDTDIIFGCTDDDFGRAILNQMALRYCIPLIDMGVLVDSQNEKIQSVCGRVTTVYPGTACLICRNRITAERIRRDSLLHFNPLEAEGLQREGYAPELEENAPAVIPFTSSIASTAVTELLQRLAGFMYSGRTATEIIHSFDREEIGHNSVSPAPGCLCRAPQILGVGDTADFLGMKWG